MRRMNNQDALAVVVTDDEAKWSSHGHLLLVADGMGAHAAGELASKLAADNIPHTYFKLRDLRPPAALRQAIREVNAMIFAKGQSNIGFQGMGTTCSCLVLLPQGALVAHVGDSRVYRLRGSRLVQLTFDHSLVWEMAAAGQIDQEDVPTYIPKNVITRSLGPHEIVNIDIEGIFDAAAGDVFLLCSDGLSGQISDVEIGALLSCLSPEEAVQTLVDLANLRGGPDNISVVVARLTGNDRAPAQPRPVGQKNAWWTAAAVAGATLLAALGLQRSTRDRRGNLRPTPNSLGGPYGNGPYRDTLAEPNEKIVASLAELAEKLRSLPESQGLKLDWRPLDKLTAAGKAAAERSDYGTAIRHYAEAIRDVMQQLRRHHHSTTDESGVYRV